jgi:hypothetical protein
MGHRLGDERRSLSPREVSADTPVGGHELSQRMPPDGSNNSTTPRSCSLVNSDSPSMRVAYSPWLYLRGGVPVIQADRVGRGV